MGSRVTVWHTKKESETDINVQKPKWFQSQIYREKDLKQTKMNT